MKVLVVSSVGGHLTEVMELAPVLHDHEVVLVVNDEVDLPSFPFTRVYRIAHAERDARVLLNVSEAATILLAERPAVIVSTGAGPVVPVAVVARALSDARIIFIETAAAVERPTLTGRLMYGLAHRFYVQWPGLRRWFPKADLLPLVFG